MPHGPDNARSYVVLARIKQYGRDTGPVHTFIVDDVSHIGAVNAVETTYRNATILAVGTNGGPLYEVHTRPQTGSVITDLVPNTEQETF